MRAYGQCYQVLIILWHSGGLWYSEGILGGTLSEDLQFFKSQASWFGTVHKWIIIWGGGGMSQVLIDFWWHWEGGGVLEMVRQSLILPLKYCDKTSPTPRTPRTPPPFLKRLDFYHVYDDSFKKRFIHKNLSIADARLIRNWDWELKIFCVLLCGDLNLKLFPVAEGDKSWRRRGNSKRETWLKIVNMRITRIFEWFFYL